MGGRIFGSVKKQERQAYIQTCLFDFINYAGGFASMPTKHQNFGFIAGKIFGIIPKFNALNESVIAC